MTRISADTWMRLSSGQSGRDSLTARIAVPDVSDRLVAAIDAENRRHLLIRLLSGENSFQDSQSRGLVVSTRDLIINGAETGSYIDLVCQDPSGNEVFDLIGGDIADRLAAGAEAPDKNIAHVLARWRRFWGQSPRQILSREEQLGLFAELWFLDFWLAPRIGVEEAVARWRGPFAARHDFEWPGRSVEVKATTSVQGILHRIHGIDQLSPPEGGELMLFSLRLREEAGATSTLPWLVTECRRLAEPNDAAFVRIESALARSGYSPAHDDEYSKLRLRIVDQLLYRVEGDFPRLTPDMIPAGLPTAVRNVEYEVNLDGCNHLRVASIPSEMPPI